MDDPLANAVAAQMLRDLLPASLPACGRFRLAAHCTRPVNSGGDFYDAHRLDNGALALMLADVMAKGLPAALVAAAVAHLWRATVRNQPLLANEPAALLSFLNRQLNVTIAEVEMFVSMQVALVDTARRELVVASAGHAPLVLTNRQHPPLSLPRPAGLPLGMFARSDYRQQSAPLGEDCRVLLFSDGLTESLNTRGETFGAERLQHWLAAAGQQPWTAEQLTQQLTALADRFTDNIAPGDDRVFLLLVEEAAATELAVA